MYEIFEKLLAERGITPYKLSKETGISTATLTSWKQGKYTPKPDKMKKIADYLGVSVNYLATGEESDLSDGKYYINEETQEMAQAIFKNKELRLLFSEAMDAQPEDLKATHDILLALKRKERGND